MLTEIKMDTKVCRKCKEVKTLDGFSKDKSKKDGCQTKCKACKKEYDAEYRAANPDYQAEYRAENPEKVKEGKIKYRAANSEKIKEYSDEYRAANPEKIKDSNAKYYAANSEKIKEYNAEYYAANFEKIKDYCAEYYEANPEKFRARNSNRRAAKLEAIPSWLTEEDWQAMDAINKEAKRIELETGTKMHVDHIHPLQGKLICGLHCPSNLQILTAAENCSKRNKFTPYVESDTQTIEKLK